MIGFGVLKGLAVTLNRFFETYFVTNKLGRKHFFTPEGIQSRYDASTEGIFTIQYPEEQPVLPEEFRVLPFLIYEINDAGEREYRCTACGICAKVCPPQCIWITRKTDPGTGRPSPHPEAFFIDIDICMNCGFCAEYCPFDAIKMDHDFEVSAISREHNIFSMEQLGKPLDYYAKIRPENFQREESARAPKKATDVA
jgi:NADH-quinone oxidoreductase subunit I